MTIPTAANLICKSTIPVVIIGAGPVGLTLSLLLSKYGIRSHIIEKEKKIMEHPKAHFINTRTMEIFRSLGLDAAIYNQVRPLHEWRKFKYCTSVIGKENIVDIGETDHFSSSYYFQGNDNTTQKSLYTELKKNSPCSVANLSQAKLTKILYNNVNDQCDNRQNNSKLGTIDMGAEVESIHVNNNDSNKPSLIEVVSKKTMTNETEESTIQCNYLIGADGASSIVRQALNIKLNGLANMQYLINVHFHCPNLSQYLENRHAMLYFVFNHKCIAVFIAHDIEHGDWVVQIPYFPPQQHPSDFDERKCLEILKDSLICDENDAMICKFEELAVDIKSIKPWTMSGLVADEFLKDNMLLVGDAAHQFPPSGGFGMNTGIQDAHNLAWKLSKTIKRDNDNSESDVNNSKNNFLLKSYEIERKPIAKANNELSIGNFKSAMRIPEALGLSPSHANLVSKVLASSPIAQLPHMVQRSMLDNIMSLGLKQLHITGPNNSNLIAKQCKKRVQQILRNGRGLHLLFPAYELGFQYGAGALIPSQADNSIRMASTLESNDKLMYTPSTCPGARFPHLKILEHVECQRCTENSILQKSSSIDLFGQDDNFVILFDLSNDNAIHWVELYLKEPHEKCRIIGFDFHTIDDQGTKNYDFALNDYVFFQKEDMFDDVHSMMQDNAFVVRPDGHVAWRSAMNSDNIGNYLPSFMDRILNDVLQF